MIFLDVNILLYAYRQDAKDHPSYKKFLQHVIDANEPYAIASVVFSGFLRIVTHPKVYAKPTPIRDALKFVSELRKPLSFMAGEPGPKHWGVFTELCEKLKVTGNLVPDAYLAAIAIEHGWELISTDKDFKRFPKLRLRHPIE